VQRRIDVTHRRAVATQLTFEGSLKVTKYVHFHGFRENRESMMAPKCAAEDVALSDASFLNKSVVESSLSPVRLWEFGEATLADVVAGIVAVSVPSGDELLFIDINLVM